MTPVEDLDRVRTHLLTQGRRSLRAPDSCRCAYRSPDGLLSCAVGCLIADSAYDPVIEGTGVAGLGVEDGTWVVRSDDARPAAESLARVMNASGVPADAATHRLLRRLQSIHDNLDPSGWRPALDAIAAEFDGP